MSKKERSIELFRGKFNCAQSVLAVFGPDYGLTEDDCLRLSTAFGGGMGRKQYVCGAVTGALMSLGLKYGKALNDSEEKKESTYIITREFFEEFRKIHGSLNCLDLLGGLNLNDPADHEILKQNDVFHIKCEKYITDAVSITEKLIS